MKSRSSLPPFTLSSPEDYDIGEEEVGDIIDVLNLMHMHGCDDDYTVEKVVAELLELGAGDREEVRIECNDVVIKVRKKDSYFETELEPVEDFTPSF